MKKFLIIASVLLYVGLSGYAQADTPDARPLSVRIEPTLDIPLSASAPYFSSGATLDIALQYIPEDSRVFVFGGMSYSFAPLEIADSISIFAGKLGVGTKIPLTSLLSVNAHIAGGYFYGTINDFSTGSSNPYAEGGAGLVFSLNPTFDVEVGTVYRSYFGLYQGIGVAVGTRLGLRERSVRQIERYPVVPQPMDIKGGIELVESTIAPVFPVFYKYYDENPFGSILNTNTADDIVSDIVLQVFVQQYMDNPKQIKVDRELAPGEGIELNLYALFTDEVLSITEGTKVSAELTFTYDVGDQPSESNFTESVRFLNRNAMTWADDRRAAAFITARDPAVLGLAKNAVGIVRNREVQAIDLTVQTAMVLHEALDLYGINYVPDPTTPYIELSTQSDAIDFLQFPRQTLQYRAGDCDDLSILYSALLESVGIETAFVTTPGHIYLAVDTGLTPLQAAAALVPEDGIIVHDDRAWIPVEITLRHQGFLRAWDEGARQWNQAQAVGKAGFYPINDAWSVYEPVGLPGLETSIVMPEVNDLVSVYDAEMKKFVDREIYPIVSNMRAEIESTGSITAMNKLGIIFARYGQVENARELFGEILTKDSAYVPAIRNLGNVAFIQKDWLAAKEYFELANSIRPDSPHVLLTLARISRELQNFGDSQRIFSRLQTLDPELAEKHGYLGAGPQDGSVRAADIQTEQQFVLWAEG